MYFEDELFQHFDEIYREKRKGLLLKSHPKLEFPLKQGILYKRGAQVITHFYSSTFPSPPPPLPPP